MTEAFEKLLSSVPWFGKIGQLIDDQTIRLHEWYGWPGPEEEGVCALHSGQQELFERLKIGDDNELEAIWDQIHHFVLMRTSSILGIDPSVQDAWDPMATACWQAAWTAALIGVMEHIGEAPPTTIQQQWNWFVAGHWPVGYTDASSNSLLVL